MFCKINFAPEKASALPLACTVYRLLMGGREGVNKIAVLYILLLRCYLAMH